MNDPKGLQPYQQRVLTEHDELQGRLDRLTTFLSSTAAESIDPTQRALLHLQHAIMVSYLEVLQMRIVSFGET